MLRTLDSIMRQYAIPASQHARHILYICLTVAAEQWVAMHPDLDEEDCARLFGEMAREAVRAQADAMTLVAAKRGFVKGDLHHD